MGLSDNDKSIKFDLPAELKAQIEHAAGRADLSVAQWMRATARAALGGQGYREGHGLEHYEAVLGSETGRAPGMYVKRTGGAADAQATS